MIELTLLGPHADGSQIVFTDPEGKRYLVTIDDALKAVIRRDSLQSQPLPAADSPLRPRQIQELLRAGMTAAEIASEYDVEVAFVSKFRSPVESEKRYIISQCLKAPVGTDNDCPALEDLVIDRLATVSVDPASLQWNATRKTNQPWELHLSFVQAARARQASWEVTGRGAIVRALNDEARWLTETTAPAPSSFTSNVMPLTRPGSSEEPSSLPSSEDSDNITAFLDELAAARGKRQQLEDNEDDSSPTGGTVQPFQSLRAKVSAATNRQSATATSPKSHPDATDSKVEAQAPAPAAAASTTAGESSQVATPPAHHSGGESDPSPAAKPAGAADEGGSSAPSSAAADSDSATPRTGHSEVMEGEETLPGLESLQRTEAPNASPSTPPSRRSNRRSVPSWAEIVFGSSRTDSGT